MTFLTSGGVLTATAGLDEVQHGRPAHEAVIRRVVLVEHRPERAECVVVPSLAESRCGPGKVRGGEQRAALHRRQCSLRPGEHRIEVGFATAQRSGQRAYELTGEPELRLASFAREGRRLGACPLGRFPITRVGGSPCVVDERLREHAEPALLAQPLDRAREEAGACREVARLLCGDAHIHRSDRIGHLLQAQACHSAPHRRRRRLRIGERDDNQQSWVLVRKADAFGRIDDVLPRPGAGPRPPAAMRDRHERAQCRIRIAAGEQLLRDRDERLGGALLEPDVTADHLLQPGQAGGLERTHLK